MGGPTGLSHASYFVGPAVGSNADAESVGVVAVAGAYSGDSYAKDGTVTTDAYDLSNDAATIQNDGQVYLFAWKLQRRLGLQRRRHPASIDVSIALYGVP
mgnify:CR=1 FL=1